MSNMSRGVFVHSDDARQASKHNRAVGKGLKEVVDGQMRNVEIILENSGARIVWKGTNVTIRPATSADVNESSVWIPF